MAFRFGFAVLYLLHDWVLGFRIRVGDTYITFISGAYKVPNENTGM